MNDVVDIFKEVCGNNYKICYSDNNRGEIWIYGEVLSCTGLKVTIWCEDKGLHTIPHSSIKWMIPNGLTRQKKEKMASQNEKEMKSIIDNLNEEIKSFEITYGKKPSFLTELKYQNLKVSE